MVDLTPGRRDNNPGEPLFTTDEIAAKLGIKPTVLRRALVFGDGPKPWNPLAASGKGMYRLSDFKKWPRLKEAA